jgi:hypothetical protein
MQANQNLNGQQGHGYVNNNIYQQANNGQRTYPLIQNRYVRNQNENQSENYHAMNAALNPSNIGQGQTHS